MKDFAQFTGLYSVEKTLRFELIPVEGTEKTIQEKGIISDEEERNQKIKKGKMTIDAYHREFIDASLRRDLTGGESGNKDTFEKIASEIKEYSVLYKASADRKKTTEWKDSSTANKQQLYNLVRELFVKRGNTIGGLETLLKKEDFIKTVLPEWAKTHPDVYSDEEVFRNATAFSDFRIIRENLYSAKGIHGSVAFRVIDENLPRHIDNITVFESIRRSEIKDAFPELCKDMANYLDGKDLNIWFSLDMYPDLLTQEAIDRYNRIIGAYRDETGNYAEGINIYINQHNQKYPDEKIALMQPLYKQILSESSGRSFIPAAFESADEVITAVKAFRASMKDEFAVMSDLLCDLSRYDSAGIYISDKALGKISARIFGDYSILLSAMNIASDEGRKSRSYSFREIQEAFAGYRKNLDREIYRQAAEADEDYLKRYFSEEANRILSVIRAEETKLDTLPERKGEKRLNEEEKRVLKDYLDCVLEAVHLLKHLCPPEKADYDKLFYNVFTRIYDGISEGVLLYDKVRNFATQKPYQTEKINLSFRYKGNFLSGWTDSRTETSDHGTQYGGYLFRKKNGIGEYDYFLGISKNAKLFREGRQNEETKKSVYERLDYYQMKSDTIYGPAYKGKRGYRFEKSEMIRLIREYADLHAGKDTRDALKKYQDSTAIELQTPSQYLTIIKNNEPEFLNDIKTWDPFRKQNALMIQELRDTLRSLDRVQAAKEMAEKEYSLVTDMIGDIDRLAKASKVYSYHAVEENEFRAAISDKDRPLYLFKISNKDLAYAEAYAEGRRKSKGLPNVRGKDNLHTMYFRSLMEGGHGVLDIGTGKVFFRKKSLPYRVTHPKGEPIGNKNPNAAKKESVFDYDLIKDRRYAADRYSFHLSIKQNYTAPKSCPRLNDAVSDYIRNNPDVNVIGIDRGERNLLYVSVIDRSGRVIKDENGRELQYSLNTINGSYRGADGNEVLFETPYQKMLDEREKKRDENRKNWDSIETIKDLKSGYLSQVVHHITSLMVKYNAIVVLEDLNSEFKRGRFKVEKQVYQNFEKALIDKLNYLVFKDYAPDEPGGLHKALQLTGRFESFEKMQRQVGFLFYVQAWNTSRIDPVTGFVDLLKPKYRNRPEAEKLFRTFRRIEYNTDRDWFEFEFDYRDFKIKNAGMETHWTVCTHGDTRYTYQKEANGGRGGTVSWNVTEKLKVLFTRYGIDYRAGDLREEICRQEAAGFFAGLIKNLQVTLALRYSSAEENRDFILSPVADGTGRFFFSEEGIPGLPRDADANGAYNIARKGLMLLQRIDRTEGGRVSTAISNKDWLAFAQSFGK